MFGDSAQGTGVFPTAVKKADGSIIEKPLELEGEGGSSVSYLDATISIRRNCLHLHCHNGHVRQLSNWDA